MGQPLFSCVVPVRGSRPYLGEALDSLKKQGMDSALEVIVQDGDVEPDCGQSDALNLGFAKTRGEWLFWLNADDLLLPGALEKVRRLITQNPRRTTSLDWIAGNQLLIDDAGKVQKCSVGNGWHDWLYSHSVPHVYGPSSFFRRGLFERAGGFDVSLKYCMDWDLWIRLMKAGAQFERIDAYLWAQRQWRGSKTQREKSRDEAAVQWAEINGMLEKNGLNVTSSGNALMRLWRLFNGNIPKEFVGTIRCRGRHYSEVVG